MSEEILGFVKLKKAEKTKGSKKGWAGIELDNHALAYILKGLNCRIDVYERMRPEDMAQDDVESFEYTKQLRDRIEDVRNATLPE